MQAGSIHSMSIRQSLSVTSAVVVLALCVTGCSSSSNGSGTASASPSPASESSTATPSPTSTNPYGVATVDPPGPGEPILVLSGGSAGTVSLTYDELATLPTRTITISEPFVKEQQTFTGVAMSDLFAKAGIPDSARVDTLALNDYHYVNTAGAFTASDGLLAIERNGQPIPYDAGGPVRIVYPDGTPLASVLDAWNWSLSSMSVTTATPTG